MSEILLNVSLFIWIKFSSSFKKLFSLFNSYSHNSKSKLRELEDDLKNERDHRHKVIQMNECLRI